jgi:hypothetical protein
MKWAARNRCPGDGVQGRVCLVQYRGEGWMEQMANARGDCELGGNVVSRGAPGHSAGPWGAGLGPGAGFRRAGRPAGRRAVDAPGPGGAARDQALLALAWPDDVRQNVSIRESGVKDRGGLSENSAWQGEICGYFERTNGGRFVRNSRRINELRLVCARLAGILRIVHASG